MASIPPEGPGQPPDDLPSGQSGLALGLTASVMVLVLLLLGTVGVWRWSVLKARADLELQFQTQTQAMTIAFRDRLEEYEMVLDGARGLFAQGHPVERQGWRIYTEGLHLDHARPGIQGLGFARALKPGEAATVARAMRSGGLDWFKNWPPMDPPASTITLLEPMNDRNLRAFGFDMTSEPRRRAAMELARDSGVTAFSAKVTLVQEEGEDIQAGFLMYLPVYEGGSIPPTREARRSRLLGWVYSPFRVGDFSRAVLGTAWPGLRVELFDGPSPDPTTLMYDSHPAHPHRSRWIRTRPMDLGARTWTFRISSLPDFEARQDATTPTILLLSGLAISLLIFGLLHGLVRLRRRAHLLARQMTAAVREEQEHVRRILDSTAEGIYGMDLAGRCTFVNEAFLRLSGARAEDLLGRSIHAQAHHSHPDGSPYPVETCPIFKALHAGASLRMEDEWFWRQDGSGYWANVVVAPILNRGIPVGSVVTLENVTQQREAEKTKHDFISVVSHELRTPLTSIRGTLGLLGSGQFQEKPEESRRLLAIALRNTERLGTLINDILDFEKLRAGRLSLTLESTSLRDLLMEALEANLPFASGFQVMLHLRPNVPEGAVRVDRRRMLQVLTNLISNAVKFSPEGSQVDLEADLRGDRVLIRVADRGRGIPEAFRSRLFTPFSQAESPETRSREGSGLGLSITKALVEDMGGTLTFTSEEGVGTTFTIDLPLAAQA
ncbi:MAG TPA: CHASE domain-containing protein [Holophagaceae bacterium]|nr:CHASE domain-containing protein [Holophagaceae bacterium]